MYSDKSHINYLTRILLNQGITDIVVCPGARNAPLCHNFNEAGFILHPVTDERSAAFVALGVYLETRRPTLVCVTSGSALLNTLPAVAEAFYRHIPLVVVSADRPEEWIGQLDGQTIPQKGALQPYAKCINIAEDDELDGLPLRIAEELRMPRPLHINVELEEPLFNFTVKKLPQLEKIELTNNNPLFEFTEADLQTVANAINEAEHPLLMMGQIDDYAPYISRELQPYMAVIPEITSNCWDSDLSGKLEIYMAKGMSLPYTPDLVIHIGGSFVCKQMKLYLRKQPNIRVIRIGFEEIAPKTFGRVNIAVRTSPIPFLQQLLPLLNKREHLHKSFSSAIYDYSSKLFSTKAFHELKAVQSLGIPLFNSGALHIANSCSVRLINTHFSAGETPVYCNRGVNGIEGTLSTAAGQSLKTDKTIGCVIGDLSFFYDVNALWNTRLSKNLIVLLLNNGGGDIFYKLDKLNTSPALDEYIAAHHTTTAEGVCASYNINYICKLAGHYESKELKTIVNNHLASDASRPLVIEILLKSNN